MNEIDTNTVTVEELRKLKQEWYNKAQSDGSIDACYLVCRELGQRLSENYGPKYRWDHDGINIYVDDYGHYMIVNFNGREVCSTYNYDYGLFVPGEWFEIVKKYAEEARKVEQNKKTGYKEQERQKMLKELGLA